MLTEDYCSYEVAKLLGEKRFNGQTHGNMSEIPCVCYITYQMAMKWLREEKRIAIIIEFDLTKRGFCPYVYQLDYDMDWVKNWRINIPMKYEEAIEAALKYCLTELI